MTQMWFMLFVPTIFNDGFNGMYKSTNAGGSYTLVSSTPNILSGDPAGNGDGGQGLV
jgi:hypothetical protein